ncbi:tetratricopeptide repeat protein [Chitinophaga vietnamensis]|uniref:tetratricopeptide repeat protein n=1 Tax=Chitinophaga vietnamensis TaxID=2593957 RepID=UPI001177647C|nr:tetratricopeptide repeat protein [Chitinophaga vietnamensis]
MKKYAGIILLVLSVQLSLAQEQLSLEKQAAAYYDRYDYARAASMYERIAAKRKEKTSTEILARLANAYRQNNRYGPAVNWYAKLLARADAPPDARLYYGDMLKSLGQYAEAKAAYTQYAQTGNAEKVKNRIAGCDAALEWMQSPTPVLVHNVARLNTAKSDWGATPYPGRIVFMSDTLYRQQLEKGSRFNRNKYRRSNRDYYKLYETDTGSYGNVYIKDFSPSVNWSRYHVGPAVFDKSYQVIYVTMTNPRRRIPGVKEHRVKYGYRRLELYTSEKDHNGKWGKLVAFPYNKPDEYSLGHAALSNDGNTLYFAADMPGGQGGTDIWYCDRQADGKWSAPVNCGPSINTSEDEEFPTIAPDGSLYFSSKGWPGMGGFDLFRSSGSKAQWSTPENLRYPTNSPGDDFYFVSSGGATYFASNRPGGKGGDDIYSITNPDVYTLTKTPVALVIPFIATICPTLEGACIYLYNRQRGIGWCFLGERGREINMTLEKETDYVIRMTYAGQRRDSIEFNTRGMKDGETLKKVLCPEKRGK